MRRLLLLIFIAGILCTRTDAASITDSVEIRFRVNKSILDPNFDQNRQALERIADSLKTGYSDSIYRLQRVMVIGGASPEGSVALNQRLSEQRAQSIFDYLSRYGSLPEELTTFKFLGRDWKGLRKSVFNDPEVPYRDEVLDLLDDIIADASTDSPNKQSLVAKLKAFKGGVPDNYMLKHNFPELRASKLILWYEKIKNPAVIVVEKPSVPIHITDTLLITDTVFVEVPVVQPCKPDPWYAALRTNLVYDALLVPNVGIEWAFHPKWSIMGNWMYAWWKTDRRHRYWRIYGGDVELRRWFGPAADEKPLTGHHLGVYGQLVTYDVEFGGKGVMGGLPGGNIWNRASYGFGISYGYSLPVSRRFNIDFSLGVGYFGGRYYEYYPDDGCYVWKATKFRNWVGPTKLEITLSWLFGTGNYNAK